jgi:HEAT repeat protein
MRAMHHPVRAACLPPLALVALLAGCQATRGPSAPPADEALSPTITRLTASLRNEDGRESAQAALVAIGEPAVPPLRTALSDPDPEVRLAAIETLEEIRTPTVVEPLLAAAQDQEGVVRLRAVEALGVVRDARAVQPLMARYPSDDDDQVRYEILTTLGKIGDPRAADFLIAETRSRDRYVRMWAMDALCTMRADRAPTLVRSLMEDPEPYVRRQVLRSCEMVFDTPPGHAALINIAATDADFDATVEARRQIRNAVQRAGTDAALREQIRTVGRIALTGPQPAHAALLLADIGDSSGAPVLREALVDPNVFVRHHAAYALGHVGGPESVPALIAALGDPQPLVTATAYDSLSLFAERGDARAKTAVAGYRGKRFEGRLPR